MLHAAERQGTGALPLLTPACHRAGRDPHPHPACHRQECWDRSMSTCHSSWLLSPPPAPVFTSTRLPSVSPLSVHLSVHLV